MYIFVFICKLNPTVHLIHIMENIYTKMKHKLRLIFILSCVLFISISTKASHIVGADLFYTHISGNNYKITFIAYADCGPASSSAFATLSGSRPQICIYNANTFVTSINLTIDTPASPFRGEEITPVCPRDSANTQCTNPTFTIPGIKKFVYTGTYTVPSRSSNWRFIYNGTNAPGAGAGRLTSITNIVPGTVIYLIDTLNNSVYNNNNPILTVVPTPFFCLNSSDTYNPGAIDADGDSLRFDLITGIDGSGNCMRASGPVTYVGGTSATNPLRVSAGTFSFNNATGTVNFFPNVVQRALVVFNIREFRNDTLIGTSQREMTFLVITCSNPPPAGGIATSTGRGSLTDSTHYEICENSDTFSFYISPRSTDTTMNIKVSTMGLPTGATFTTRFDSTNHPECVFRWTSTGVAPGVYTFFVTYRDDGCPISGTRTIAYTVTINPTPVVRAGGGAAICIGGGILLVPSGATSYTWSPGTGLSCTACATPGASPTVTTVYTVTGSFASGCFSTDTVRVTVNPNPSPIIGISAICVGDTTTFQDTTAGGRWSSSNSTIATVNPTTGLITGISAGTVNIFYTLTGTGCLVSRRLTVNPLPSSIGGPASVCLNSSITLTNTTAGGTWSSANTSIATIGNVSGIATGVGVGTTTISYSLATGCFTTRAIVVNPIPDTIAGPREVCQNDTIYLTNAVTGGTWTSSNTAIATITGTAMPARLIGVSGGSVVIRYTLPSGCYVEDTIIVNPLPAAITGPTFACLRAAMTLASTSTGGTWSSSNTSVATINSTTGVVTSVSFGTTIITYTLPTGCFVTRSITVNPIPSIITGDSIECQGYTSTLRDSVSGGTWTSSNTAVATVNATTGLVTFVAPTTATITYTLPAGCFITTTVTVNPLPASIGGPTFVCMRSTITVTNTSAGGRWSSANSGIASIDSITGVVTGVGTGTTTLTYTLPTGCFVTRAITVNPIPSVITGPTTLCEGNTITLLDSVSGGTWSSSATGVATIHPTTGLVTGTGGGTATITYTLPAGCFAVYTITVNPLPGTIGGPTYVCLRASVTLTNSRSGGRWSSSNSTVASIDSITGVATGIAIGTVTITYMLPTGCFTTRTLLVNPTPSAITGPTQVCAGSSITLTDSVVSGTWSSSSTTIATINSFSGVLTGVAAGTATITYTMSGGCFVTYNIRVNPLPDTIGGPRVLCMGSTITKTNTVSGGRWYSSNTGVATIDSNTGVLTPVALGTTTITYILPTGCLITTTVTVNPLPNVITGDSVVCEAATITMYNTTTGGSWSSASTTIATVVSTSGLITGVLVGTTTISYTLPTGCFRTKDVTVRPLPRPGTISGPSTVCVGTTITLIDTVSGGTWSSADTSIATITSTGVVSGLRIGSTTISYTLTNDCGTRAATYRITVLPQPNAGTITGANTVCVGSTTTLRDSVAGGTWSSSTTAIATISGSGVVFGVSAGTTTISYSYTNSCGTDVAIFTMNVLPLPVLSITPASVAYCIGSSGSMSVSGAATYTWSPATALSATTGSTVIASPTVTTTYVVTGVGSNGCIDSTSRMVVVYPLPVITATSATICNGSSATVSASGAFTYTWTPGTGLSATTGASVVASPSDSIMYTITGTDVNGCVGRTTSYVYVNPIPPAPSVTTPVDYCLMDVTSPLTAIGTGLLWYSTATGGVGSAASPSPTSTTAGSTFYYVSQTINGCEGPRAPLEVRIFNNAIANFTYTIKFGCTRDTVVFNNNSQYCDGYLWHFGDNTTSTTVSSNPEHYYPVAHVPTNYTVKLVGYSTVCNDDSSIQVITLTPNPFPVTVLYNVTSTQSIQLGSSVQLNAMGASLYFWTPNDGTLSNPNINNPIVTPTADSTVYTVFGYDDDGCLDSAKVKIYVNYKENETLPTAFSPNGDGLNDVFRISGIRFTKLLDFRIFNRWGEEVFSTNDKTKGWDGYYKNEPQDIGVYSYLIIVANPDGPARTIKGNVTLVR